MKYAANIISVSRIAFALLMCAFKPFGLSFYACYVYCGISDIADGFVARRSGTQSHTGAKLDSIADASFVTSVFTALFRAYTIPKYLFAFSAVVLSVRVISYATGYIKFRTFSSIHTCLNKITGTGLFLLPVLSRFIGINACGIIICFIALLSSAEELIIIVRSKTLEPDKKSVFEVIAGKRY